MTSKKPKLILQISIAILALSFTMVSCGGSGDKKETTDSTTMSTTPVDTTKMMMDTTKLDTGATKPVKPGE